MYLRFLLMMKVPGYTRLRQMCLAFALASLTIAVSSEACPGECSITTVGNRTVADCSGIGLDCLPSSLPTNVLVLDFSKNPIFNLRDIFNKSSLKQLEEIYLSQHVVDDIEKNAFRSLENILVIDLSHNRLQTVHHDIFVENSKLRKVNFRNNFRLKMPETGIFLNAPSIEHLDLSFCNIQELQPQLFSQLIGITHLSLEGNALKTIEEVNFGLLPKLEYLDLSNNLLQSLDNTTFTNHRNLKTLILKNNFHMDFSAFKQKDPNWDWLGVRISHIFLQSDSLEILDISSVFMKEAIKVSYNFFCGTPKLRILNISHNRLYSFGTEHLSCLTEVEEIDCTGFHTFSIYQNTSKSNTKLWKLLLKQDGYTRRNRESWYVFEYSYFDIPSLTYLDINAFYLRELDHNLYFFSKLKNLTFLNISSCYVPKVGENMFTLLKDLEIVDISSCEITNLPWRAFERNEKLKELYVRNNLLGNSTLTLYIPTLEVLDLSCCSLTDISGNSFAKLQKLRKLYLGGNSFIEFPKDTLKHLENLEYLDLSNCELMFIDPQSFSSNPKLAYLSLQGNALHAFHQGISIINSLSITTLELSMCSIPHLLPETFANVTNLRALYLNNNELSSLKVSVMSNLVNLTELQLFGNPWRCDCALKALRDWTLSRKIKQNKLIKCESPLDMIDWSWAEAGAETCDPSLPKNCMEVGVELLTDTPSTTTQETQQIATGSSVQNKDMKLPAQGENNRTFKPPSSKSNVNKTSVIATPNVSQISTIVNFKFQPKEMGVTNIIDQNRDQSSPTYSSLIGRGIAAGFFAFVCIAAVGFALYSFVIRRYFPSKRNSLDYNRTLEIEESY